MGKRASVSYHRMRAGAVLMIVAGVSRVVKNDNFQKEI